MAHVLRMSAALGAALGLSATAHAAVVLDQSHLPANLRMNDSLEFQQQVTVGRGGQLMGVTLFGSSRSNIVRINEGSGFYSGPYAFSETVSLAPGGTFIDTSAAGIFLTAGQTFVIDVTGGDACCHLRGSEGGVPYAGGDLFENFGVVHDETAAFGESMAFQSFMSAAPEPAAWALMLVGFGLTGAMIRSVRRARVA